MKMNEWKMRDIMKWTHARHKAGRMAFDFDLSFSPGECSAENRKKDDRRSRKADYASCGIDVDGFCL